ncbi:MAG: thioesterase family protein [Kofleriaceae bacterium]
MASSRTMDAMPPRPAPPQRSEYPHVCALQTRWMDNDLYGHLNNVVYYALFDSLINRYLIEEGGLDLQRSESLGFVVQSSCTFAASVAYPDALEGGLRVAHLGSSSVRYEVAIFLAGDPSARAYGDFTHVFVDRQTQRPRAIEEPLRSALARLVR